MDRRAPPDAVVSGEEAIIALLAPLTQGSPGAFGLKDDCALLAPPPDTELVLKTDPVAEGIHFLPGDSPQDVAWKALAVNVSDLAAKGAAPLGYLMAVSFPAAPTVGWMTGFVEGLQAAQTWFGCHLMGGDTDRRPGPLTIAITAIGSVPRGRMVPRTTAQAGDALFVSGTIGDAGLGLQLAKTAALETAWGLSDAEASYLRQRYRRPQPRLGLAAALRQYASAAMDISDGLIKDLERMGRASGVASRLVAADVPLSNPARRVMARAPERLAELLTAGDDYEVLATVPQDKARLFAAAAKAAGIAVTEIGGMLPGPPVLSIAGPSGGPLALPERTGWDHF
ncbi:MAG: thiamine-phosphate kinase [Hyphomonadaceae bacterium]|jgi:thiamine-monophosphate kinase|nr:thiamine-phosphate kinase [Hyphomonadaceae bacterium]